MKLKKCMLLLLMVMALLTVTVMAEGETTGTDLPTKPPVTEEHDHYALCTAPDVCAVCGEPYTGYDIEHPDKFFESGHSHYENDGKNCWQICDAAES